MHAAVFTGMRSSELRGLPWGAVDFDTETINVRQRADEWGVIGSPKSEAGSPVDPHGATRSERPTRMETGLSADRRDASDAGAALAGVPQ